MSSNAFKRLMEASRGGAGEKKCKTDNCKGARFDWKNGLLNATRDPALLVETTDTMTIIKDKYPKASSHYLILPKTTASSPAELGKEHVQLLKQLEIKAHSLASKEPNLSFKFGFHARPSMAHLHLHVISCDFISPSLKTKKHWNSFTTSFFLNLSDLITELENNDKINIPTDREIKKLLDTPLLCNQCKFQAKTMPDLKTHLAGHLNNVSNPKSGETDNA